MKRDMKADPICPSLPISLEIKNKEIKASPEVLYLFFQCYT